MFDWKDDSRKKNNLGLIAQEVEQIIPQINDENEPSEMVHKKLLQKNLWITNQYSIVNIINSKSTTN